MCYCGGCGGLCVCARTTSVFLFCFSIRLDRWIGLGLIQSKYNPIGLTRNHLIGLLLQAAFDPNQKYSDRIGSDRIRWSYMPTPSLYSY